MSETKTNAIPALQALQKHLRERREHGTERVYLSPEALADLNALPAAIAASNPAPTSPRTPPATASSPPPPPPPEIRPGIRVHEESPPAANAPDKRARLRDIAIRAKRCPDTRALGTLHNQFVFAAGNPDAELMFIGDAPGPEEEKTHKPFVDPAGQLLDKIIKAMGFERDAIYLSNIVKFRPAASDGNRRKPTSQEMATSLPYVIEEIAVVQPKAIVALGAATMECLLELEGGIDSHRTKFHSFRGIPVMVTYHPSHLLATPKPSEKRKVWEDLLLVMEQLQIPISPSQRNFFRPS